MNDPWDVKSVRHSEQYMSCMKINGVPLLPPLLSKECRKEMQYYKLLAKEVENRIQTYRSLIPDSDSDEDKTDAPDIPEFEDLNVNKLEAVNEERLLVDSLYSRSNSNDSTTNTIESVNITNSTKLVIDLSVNINENQKFNLDNANSLKDQEKHELPERDCIYPVKGTPEKEKNELERRNTPSTKIKENIKTCNLNLNSGLLDRHPDISLNDGPSSLSSKSFTGSLIDIHAESLKESQNITPLVRQRSYTVLKPSPQLLAHLEVQSLSTGIEMTSISMSESLSNLSLSHNKKRRSWDLETAKVQWSTMARELKEKNSPTNDVPKTTGRQLLRKSSDQDQKTRSRSAVSDRKRSSTKASSKSEPACKPVAKKSLSPVRSFSNRSVTKETATSPYAKVSSSSPKKVTPTATNCKSAPSAASPAKPLISESDDPAARVRELYERIQNQQLRQMANLVEKQKREQMLLQQVFEEQNNLLYNQLKIVCPKSPVEIKQAWADKDPREDQGPVSLSQLINKKPGEPANNSFCYTLTETNNYISHCDDVLKKSRNITSSLKKPTPNSNPRSIQNQGSPSPHPPANGIASEAPSPLNRSAKTSTPRRQIKYDSSFSERDFEPILTDRTNDTLADLNVTFPSDDSGPIEPFLLNENTFIRQPSQETVVLRSDADDRPISSVRSGSSTSVKSNGVNRRNYQPYTYQPTPKQCAAATKITAVARGYLVRRLMRSERVQATVQTIRDALLCALQLHEDREGIRGADVDLHRRLIQQITAACYTLHDTFIASTPAERCGLIAADRARRKAIQSRNTPPPHVRQPRQTRYKDVMSHSHSGAFPSHAKRNAVPPSMSQSNYETFSDMRTRSPVSYLSRRKPWR